MPLEFIEMYTIIGQLLLYLGLGDREWMPVEFIEMYTIKGQ